MVVYETYPPKGEGLEESMVVGQTEIAEPVVEIAARPVKKRTRKPSDPVAKAKDAEQRRKAKNYDKQESIRAPKIQIDQKMVLWSWIIGIGIAFVSSAIVSFNGITAVAVFVGLSASWMAGLFFFFIEIMYLLFLVAYLLLSSRIDENGKQEKTAGSILGMIAFGGIAVLANGFHTLDFWNWNLAEPRMWAGIVLSISAPIAIIAASKLASRVVFAKSISLD
tara:strand:+ start:572 stop:1237 length:666 start_codon:yes stop_codon:yes gene_type:complete